MKDFNLTKALMGVELVTRDGSQVRNFKQLNPSEVIEPNFRFGAEVLVNNRTWWEHTFRSDGRNGYDDEEMWLDLFIK